jgi:L-2-hydroxyglutarate oxidase LhgO
VVSAGADSLTATSHTGYNRAVPTSTTDLLVIGGGVVGLTAALAFKRRHPDASVAVLEKESACGLHASGRNAGVLHAGFYDPPGSLKARFSREGCQRWTEFCEERGLPIRRCGKLVVVQSEDQHPALDKLVARGEANGVDLRVVSALDAAEIEPRIKTCGRALWSPTTASVDPRAIMAELEREARDRGIRIRISTPFVRREGSVVHTPFDKMDVGLVLNTAGLYADHLARQWGCSDHYRLLPFKGVYLLGDEPHGSLRVHVHPVPDLSTPLLATHITITTTGAVQIGPSALPALWRENYVGLDRFDMREMAGVVGREARMLFRSRAFSRLALRETAKASRRVLLGQAKALISGIDNDHWRTWGRPGIQAQLVDNRTHQLATDFVLERGERSLHLLNTVSPAFTCALPLAEHVVDELEQIEAS